MRDEILLAMQQMIAAITGGTVVIGSLPPLEGYAVSLTGGMPRATFWPLTSDQELPVQFTGKSADQQQLAAAMEAVHKALTTATALPFAKSWQVYAIETTAAPALIGREQNINYIYGSAFRVKFYAR